MLFMCNWLGFDCVYKIGTNLYIFLVQNDLIDFYYLNTDMQKCILIIMHIVITILNYCF